MTSPSENTSPTHPSLLQNIVAGLTVSFVALTLGAAFGVLSGRGAFAGMISAALIALVTSLLGGTRIQCSGPTGPMTAVTAAVVAIAHDTVVKTGGLPDHFVNLVLLLAGAALILMAVLRLGKFITYVPNVVTSGFMNGIALIIWADQIKRLFGLGGKAALEGPLVINALFVVLSAALTFALPPLFRKFLPKYASLLSGTLLSIIIMTAAANVFRVPIEHVQLTASIRSVSDAVNIVTSQWPQDWSFDLLKAAAPFALQLAVLGYLDTLLTSLIIDKMTSSKTKQNKELFAQGLGAGIAALFGGIPGAQATIRSVLLVKEKASMRLAGVLVGVFALAEMLLLQDLINLIPQAVFAGILIKVGYDVFDWKPLRLYLKEWLGKRRAMLHGFFSRHDDEAVFVTHPEFLIIAGTTLVTVFFDLNLAVGAFTALFYVLNKLVWKKRPMRDLAPVRETEGFADED